MPKNTKADKDREGEHHEERDWSYCRFHVIDIIDLINLNVWCLERREHPNRSLVGAIPIY